MSIRRFEFVEGSSSKFWQVEQQGSDLHIGWGKIGTNGQSQVKSFASSDAAANEADKLIKKKVKEGYVEKGGGDSDASAKAEAHDDAEPAQPAAKTKTPAKPKPTKKGAETDGPKVDSKIVTLWRKAAKLVMSRGYASTYEITSQPGAWDAFVAALDAGDVPLEAVWKFGENAMDQVPARLAVDLVAARPAQFTDLWHLHSLAIVPMIKRLREESTAFDALRANAPAPLPALIDIAKIQAGIAPAGSASADVREAIATRWTQNISIGSVKIEDGVAKRVPKTDDTAKELGTLLLGEQGIVDALADGYRRLVQNPTRPYPDDATLRIAAASLTPEEVTRFHIRYVPFWHIAQTWSVDQIVRAALAARASGNDGGLVAGTAAVLAIGRDPSVAPKVESALQMHDMTNQGAVPPSDFYAALVRTDPTWRRAWLEKTVFGPEVYPSTFSGPMGIALIAANDPAEAERLATEHAENIDYTRINGVNWQALLEAAQKGGPTLKRGLLLPITAMASRDTSSAPEAVDAMISFDGSYRDSWLVGYVVALPEARRKRVLDRAIAAGQSDAVRTAFANHPAVLASAFGAETSAAAASEPKEDALLLDANEIAKASEGIDGEKTVIYLLAEGDDASDDVGRVLGSAGHVPKSMRPKFQGESMVHVLTIDLDAMPEVRASLGKEGFRAMAFFISDLDGHAADDAGNEHAKTVWLTDKDLAKARKAADADDDEDDDGGNPAKRLRVQRVEVPVSAFAEDAEGDLATLLVNTCYAGGKPAYMQGAPDADAGKFVLQFDQELVAMNLADQGVMYVFESTAFLQSA